MSTYLNHSYWESLKGLSYDIRFALCKKTVLVTGATGMIGSCLIDVLMVLNDEFAIDCHIVALSRNEKAAKIRFAYCWDDPRFSFVSQDISKPISNLTEPVDFIIHCASNADPVNFSLHPVDTLLANVLGTTNLFDYGLGHGMQRFLFVSSGEMYGQPNANFDDFIEDYCGTVDYSSPRACYPTGKRAAEVLCQSYISQYGADAVIVRPCHIFGPTMTRGDSRAASEFLWNAVDGKDIVLKSAGLVERSHCYVVDAVKAMLQVLIAGESGRAYNIADRQYQMTIRDFAKQAADAGGCQIIFENPNDVEVQGYSKVSRAVLDPSRLEGLGWQPARDTVSAIEKTVTILRENKDQQGGAL